MIHDTFTAKIITFKWTMTIEYFYNTLRDAGSLLSIELSRRFASYLLQS